MTAQLWAIGGLLLVGTGAVLAGSGPEAEAHRGGHVEFLRQELSLTADQVEQLRRLRSEESKAQIRRRADLEVARLELHDLLTAPTLDERAIAAKVQQLNDLQAALLKARVDARLSFRKALSPEQVEKLRSLRDARSREARPRGRRPGHRPDEMGPPDGGPERP